MDSRIILLISFLFGFSSVWSDNLEAKPKNKVSKVKGGITPSKKGVSEMVHIDFPEPTDLRDVIKAVAQWTGRNVVLGRNVTGKVQIISPSEVTKEEAYEIFLSALNVAGYTTIEEGKVLKILHTRNAMKENIRTYKGRFFPKTAQVITRVIPLQYVDALAIKKTLDPFVNRAELVVYEPTNTIILSTTGHKVDHVLDVIGLLDVKTQQPVVKIVPIEHAEAKDIVDKLKQIFISTSKKKNSNKAGFLISKIMSDNRTNSVIFLGNQRAFTEVMKLIKKLDVQLEDSLNQSKIHIHPLQYADAEKLSTILSNLASGKSRSRSRFSGSKSKKGRSTNKVASVADFGDMKITAEPTTNSLIVTGSKEAYTSLNTIINKVDVRRPQVFVEADILDINLGDSLGLGTSIIAGDPKLMGKDGAMAVYGFNASKSLEFSKLGSNDASGTAATAASMMGGGASNIASLLNSTVLGVLGGEKVPFMGGEISTPTALITALKTDSNTTVLSTPSIMTSDNEEATISVGNRVSFMKFSSMTAEGRPVNSNEFEDVLLELTLKPKISQSNAISMVLNLKNDELSKTVNGQPSINKRATKTTVTVDDHQTIVISGLVRNFESEGKQKIPILGDIPILGWLFRHTSVDQQQSFLLVFLTPHIVREPKDLQEIYKKKVKDRDEFLASAFGKDYYDTQTYKNMNREPLKPYTPLEHNKKNDPARGNKTKKVKEPTTYNEEDEIYIPAESFDAGGGGGSSSQGKSTKAVGNDKDGDKGGTE